MSRVAVVADPHVACHRRFGGSEVASINQRCRLTLDVLGRALDKALQEGCEALLVLGDLFDSDHPEPQVIAAVQQRFREAQAGGMKVVVLLGNHDAHSTEHGDHALGPLHDVACVVAEPTVLQFGKIHVHCVPYQPGDPRQYIAEALSGVLLPGTTHNVLALHCGVRDRETAPWLRTATNSIDVQELVTLARSRGINQICSGDWHARREWNTQDAGPHVHVLQVGTLCPVGFSDSGLDGFGTLAVIEDGPNVPMIHEIAGPRFLKWRGLESGLDYYREAVKMRLHSSPAGELYVSWTVPAKDLAAAQERLALLKHLGLILDGEVLADEAEQEVAARTAAVNASGAATLEEALAGFCQAMQLPDGVDRVEVQRRAQGYLGSAPAE